MLKNPSPWYLSRVVNYDLPASLSITRTVVHSSGSIGCTVQSHKSGVMFLEKVVVSESTIYTYVYMCIIIIMQRLVFFVRTTSSSYNIVYNYHSLHRKNTL